MVLAVIAIGVSRIAVCQPLGGFSLEIDRGEERAVGGPQMAFVLASFRLAPYRIRAW